MVLGAEVYPNRPRKKSRAVPKGTAPVPQDTSELFCGITMEELGRIMSVALNKALDKSFDEMKENLDMISETTDRVLRAIYQRLAGAEYDDRQPHLASEADVKPDTKTRKRTEDAAADRVMVGNSCSAEVGPDPMCLTSFGDDYTEPLALLFCRDDALVVKSVVVPNPCLSLVEIRTLRAAGGLLPAGTASTATRAIFYQPPLWFCQTEDMNSKTTIQYATTYYSNFWKMKDLKTKSRQTLVFDPGGSTDRLRTCPLLGGWRALLCEVVFVWAPDGNRGWSVFW